MPGPEHPNLAELAELRRELQAMLAWHDAHAPYVEGLSDQVAAVQWSINQAKILLGVSSTHHADTEEPAILRASDKTTG